MVPSDHLILCHPLLFLPSIFPSIRVFSSESVLCSRWPKYWSFSFSIRPSNEHPGLISFRMDWLDLLAVQGTLKSLLQHHSSKASILWCSACFIVKQNKQSHKRRITVLQNVAFLKLPEARRGSQGASRAAPGKAMVFPVVMYGCESWTVKKAEC